IRMYKNDIFIKEYTKKDSAYRHLAHGPIVLDDFIGDQIVKNEAFAPAQAELIKKGLNVTARNGLSHMPLSVKRAALWLMLRYHMKPQEAVVLYNKYIGDWGGTATAYRFEAVKNGKVVKTVIKKPMRRVALWTDTDHTVLRENVSYDVAAVRIRAVDEYGNVLPYFQEPVTLRTTGPIELIGPDVISLRGGMGGTYVRTTGECGEAELLLTTQQAESVRIAFRIEK
ncbi:MAG: glycoside hydrolase family 2 protein, partial [Lachnospiraceae bacterium]|nr:glycoside hydrolase family 2 protein [Lachnospiraceae bacterium]